jgi:WD40 repeat protein
MARLVAVDGDTLQIAHEALVRVWPRLRGWLDDDVEGQRTLQHLTAAADAWDRMGRPDSELYRGARLTRAVDWRARTEPALIPVEAAFLDAGQARADDDLREAQARGARQRVVNRRLRAALGGVAVLLVLALVAGFVALRGLGQASDARTLADARRASAEAPLQEDLTAGLLLAVAALQVDDSSQALDNLGATLTRAGALTGQRDVGASVGSPGDSLRDLAVAGDLLATTPVKEDVPLFDARSLAPAGYAGRGSAADVVITPDGRTLIWAVNQWTGGAPNIDEHPLRVVDLPSGEPSAQQLGGIPPYTFVEYTLCLSADGRRAAAILAESQAPGLGHYLVWNLDNRTEPVLDLRMREYAKIALSPDGSRLYVYRDDPRPLRVFDVDSGRLLRAVTALPMRSDGGSIDASPDGTQIAVSSGDLIQRYDAVTLRPLGPPLQGHHGPVGDVRYSHDGSLLASGEGDRSVTLWDVATGAPLHRFVAGRYGASNPQFSADDATLYTSGEDGMIRTWQVSGTSRLLVLGEATETPAVAGLDLIVAAPNGHVVARVERGVLSFVDAETGRSRRAGRLDTADLIIRWSPDSRWLLSYSDENVIRVWDARAGTVVASQRIGDPLLPGDHILTGLEFSPDGRFVYDVSDGGQLTTLDRATLRAVQSVVAGHEVDELAVDPADGSVLLLSFDGSFVRVRPDTAELLQGGQPGLRKPDQGVVSPDGHRMLTYDTNGHVRLLDLDTLTYLGAPAGSSFSSDLAYAPDGSQVAAVQAERIRLWDGRTGEYQASLPLPSVTADYSIAYLPNSSGLLLASTDGRTWRADTRTSTWVARACAIAGRNLSRAEWGQFFPTRDYEVTCPQWPAGS